MSTVPFCEKCGGLMLPKDKKLTCSKCKNEKEINRLEFKLNSVASAKALHSSARKTAYTPASSRKEEDTLLIVDKEINTMPKTRAECPKCKNMEAEWWLLQTRRADEAETRFFRCTKCKFTWREYS